MKKFKSLGLAVCVAFILCCSVVLAACGGGGDKGSKGGNPDAELTSIAVTTPPNKVFYTVGQNFDRTGMVVTAFYDDDTSLAVTGYALSKTTGSGTSNLKVTDVAINVSYKEGGITKTTSVSITVLPVGEDIPDVAESVKALLTGLIPFPVEGELEQAVLDYFVGKLVSAFAAAGISEVEVLNLITFITNIEMPEWLDDEMGFDDQISCGECAGCLEGEDCHNPWSEGYTTNYSNYSMLGMMLGIVDGIYDLGIDNLKIAKFYGELIYQVDEILSNEAVQELIEQEEVEGYVAMVMLFIDAITELDKATVVTAIETILDLGRWAMGSTVFGLVMFAPVEVRASSGHPSEGGSNGYPVEGVFGVSIQSDINEEGPGQIGDYEPITLEDVKELVAAMKADYFELFGKLSAARIEAVASVVKVILPITFEMSWQSELAEAKKYSSDADYIASIEYRLENIDDIVALFGEILDSVAGDWNKIIATVIGAINAIDDEMITAVYNAFSATEEEEEERSIEDAMSVAVIAAGKAIHGALTAAGGFTKTELEAAAEKYFGFAEAMGELFGYDEMSDNIFEIIGSYLEEGIIDAIYAEAAGYATMAYSAEVDFEENFIAMHVSAFIYMIMSSGDYDEGAYIGCKVCYNLFHQKEFNWHECYCYECETSFYYDEGHDCYYKCMCGDTFQDLYEFVEHLIMVEMNGECPACEETFSDFNEFLEHYCVTSFPGVECPSCGEYIDSFLQTFAHIKCALIDFA